MLPLYQTSYTYLCLPIDKYPKADIICMKPDIKEAVMSNKKARMYAYLSAEITSLYHEAAVKMGISDTVLNILYVLCERDGQCLQSDIFRLTGISRQTINSAIRKLEKDGFAYLKQGEGRNTMVCLTENDMYSSCSSTVHSPHILSSI